jgi:hypothetical protein
MVLISVIDVYISCRKQYGLLVNPYSTSLDRNQYSYAAVKGRTEEHDIGLVWAEMLFTVC